MLPRARLLALLWFLLLPGCRRGEIASGVTDSTYVRAMIALRRLPMGPFEDSTPRIRMRDSVLRSFGLTAGQLESASAALAEQPQRAAALWQKIEIGGSDPAPATPPPPGDK